MSWWNYPTNAGPSQALSGVDPGAGQRLPLAIPIFLLLAPSFPISAFNFPDFSFLLRASRATGAGSAAGGTSF